MRTKYDFGAVLSGGGGFQSHAAAAQRCAAPLADKCKRHDQASRRSAASGRKYETSITVVTSKLSNSWPSWNTMNVSGSLRNTHAHSVVQKKAYTRLALRTLGISIE